MDLDGPGWTWIIFGPSNSNFQSLAVAGSAKQPSVTPAESMINASPTVSHSNGLARPIGKVARF